MNTNSHESRVPHILILTDPAIRGRSYHRALRKKGFEVSLADHGPEAAAVLLERQAKASKSPIDLLLIEIPWLRDAAANPNRFNDDLFPLLVARDYLYAQAPAIVLAGHAKHWPKEWKTRYNLRAVLEGGLPDSDLCRAALDALSLRDPDVPETEQQPVLKLRRPAA